MTVVPELPSPGDWGWKRKDNGGWEVHWTTLLEATKACRELLHCGCKKGCKGQCKCIKAALQCSTALCHCGGLCTPGLTNAFYIENIVTLILLLLIPQNFNYMITSTL